MLINKQRLLALEELLAEELEKPKGEKDYKYIEWLLNEITYYEEINYKRSNIIN